MSNRDPYDPVYKSLGKKSREELEELIHGLIGVAIGVTETGSESLIEVCLAVNAGRCKQPSVKVALDFIQELRFANIAESN